MARRALLMSLAFAMLLAAACASGEAAAPANVRLVTPPAPDATSARVGAPTATPTAIESPELILSAFDVQQGGALLLSVTGGITGGEAEMLGRTYPLTQGARSMYTFLPVGVLDPAGPQTVTVRFTLANGSEGTLTADVVVQATEWTVEYLEYVPAAGDAILDPVARENEAVLLAEAYATFTHEKLWGDTPWMLPVEGPVTSRFGEQRSFNGGPVEGHHGGSDFGAEEGTPVYATQPGRVVLARQLARPREHGRRRPRRRRSHGLRSPEHLCGARGRDRCARRGHRLRGQHRALDRRASPLGDVDRGPPRRPAALYRWDERVLTSGGDAAHGRDRR